MKKDEHLKDKEGSFWIRFYGKDLVGQSVPIENLSISFLALQRIIYKAYLFDKGRLARFAMPSYKDRAKLALYLGERRKESDAYMLLSNPMFTSIVGPLIVLSLKAIADYAVAALRSRRTKKLELPESIEKKSLVFLVYQPVISLVNQLDEETGILKFQIYSEKRGLSKKITFHHKDKTYMKDVGTVPFHTEHETLKGKIKTLYYKKYSALVEQKKGPSFKTFLSEKDFDAIRQFRDKDKTIEFYGRQRLQLDSAYKFIEFTAEEIYF